ncbi:TPA: hypothetical protein DDX46_03245 [Candidatus Saccharibacteria bacterium]|nr:MAG: chrJ3 protein [Candidatus Saccharibacteria bacterium GW2011_GWC2_44_17]HBH77738.1 hypothetical protein [Candidatus Saccharibacteria bacterium]
MVMNYDPIKTHNITPSVETDIFDHHPDQRFAIGVIGINTDPSLDQDALFQSYLRLRANVYIDQRQILDEDARRVDGTETDIDDERSVHIVALENQLARVAVVGCMRLIEKNTHDKETKLPIEEFFKDEFDENPAPSQAVEVSRLIVRHDDRFHANNLRTRLFARGVSHVIANDLGPAYGVVETKLQEQLERNGVPFSVVADPRYIPKYKTDNLGIMIDTNELSNRLDPDVLSGMKANSNTFQYWGDAIRH